MGYHVDKRYVKPDGTLVWRLVFEAIEAGKRVRRNVSKKEWAAIGFTPNMTFEEAKERCKQLSASSWIKTQEEKRNRIQVRLQVEEKTECAFLPPLMVEEFETRILPGRTQDAKAMFYWRAAKRVIRAVKTDPSDWFETPDAIYNHFKTAKISPHYALKLLRMLNLWGYFYCRKIGKPFYPIKSPRGIHRERIADAYYDKRQDGLTSDPLSPEQLAKAADKLPPLNYGWLFISVWLGLRPEEVDSLKDPKNWKIESSKDLDVLWVYQSKLKSVPRDKRWKLIPILEDGQATALLLIKEGMFKRPLGKTLHKHFGPKVHLYGGRKNFLPMMLEKGYRLEDIAAWLGHTHIETSWKHYRDRLRVSYKKAG